MRRSRSFHTWCHAFFSLVLLVANIFSPFRTSSLGRTFLEIFSRNAATQSVIRVRVVPPVSTALGHRAVVGLARGGPDLARIDTKPSALLMTFLPIPTNPSTCQQAPLPAIRRAPPLRC